MRQATPGRASRLRRTLALTATVALAAAACGSDEDPGSTESPTSSESPSDAQTSDGGMTVADVDFDIGVTAEPCPDTPNQDNGCIYLGVISDFTGPFSVFGDPLTEGNKRFWETVNANGGVGGLFDVSITEDNIGDSKYSAQEHATKFAEIEPDVLAFAQTLGTGQTLGIVSDMVDLDVIASVSTWWSGWEFSPNVMGFGSNYCFDAMNGIDYLVENAGSVLGDAEGEQVKLPDSIETLVVVTFAGDYGGDALAGVKAAAEANGIEILAEVEQVPAAIGGDVTAAVTAIATNTPDAVWVTTGPTEIGQIIGGSFQNGYTGLYIGSHPTFNPALLESQVAPLLLSSYIFVGPHEGYDGDSDAHAAMRAAFGANAPINDGGTFGWMMSYPLLQAMEDAVKAGDLTRAGLVAAATDMTVSFEGAIPDKVYGGDANDTVLRTTVIGKASTSATLGTETVEVGFAGSTAADFDFTQPCVSLG